MNEPVGRDLESGDARHIDRGVARRHAFLLAAREVFLEQGYEEASVNDVVRRAGGSLATLYAQFGNKEGLFLAVAQDQHERFVQAITPECVDHLKLEDGLQAIGERYLAALLDPRQSRLLPHHRRGRTQFPQLLAALHRHRAERVRAVVIDFLKSHAAQIEDPEIVAPYFLELMRGRHQYRALADETYSLSDKDLTQHVRNGVRFFLNGALPRKG